MKNPVIIIGMHRSGTSLLTRILENLHVFMGYKKEVNDESIFFQKFNMWLFEQAGASWCNPNAYCYFTHNELLKTIFTRRFKSIASLSYWGVRLWLSNKKNLLWGWKDPRNSFTLPFWLDIFPEAKILHIIRNPIDVAKSLHVRAVKIRAKQSGVTRLSFKNACKAILLRGKIGMPEQRILKEVEGVRLWKEYIERIESYQLPETTCLTIQYESLLAHPEYEIQKIINFLALPEVSGQLLQTLTASLLHDRAYAHTEEERNNLLLKCPDCKDTIARYYGEMYE